MSITGCKIESYFTTKKLEELEELGPKVTINLGTIGYKKRQTNLANRKGRDNGDSTICRPCRVS